MKQLFSPCVLASAILASSLALNGACTKFKQNSGQDGTNSVNTDARNDLSNQPTPVSEARNATNTPSPNADPSAHQKATTTNPNSARNTTDSTINTSAGAAVVGNANMNPRATGPDASVPTSLDNAPTQEPKVDAVVDKINCRDAIANDYSDKTVGKTNKCPPSGKSTTARASTEGKVPK